MRSCARRTKVYYVALTKWKDFPDGGGTNFMTTTSLVRAKYYSKKLKRKFRQIDVVDLRKPIGKRRYVLKDSWL